MTYVADFRERGFVVIPGALSAKQIETGRAITAGMLAAEPPAAGHVGPHFLWPRFGADGHPLLAFYREIGLAELAGELLRPGLALREPEFAQLATTIPPYPHRPGGPHVDGLTGTEPDGRPGTFSMLAGVWLTDQIEPDRGNLWIWPGTHLRFGQYLAERGADAILKLDDMNPGPYPKIELGAPIQAMGTAGSVLFAHYLLAHNIGGHVGSDPRETVYYRLRAEGHRDSWRDFVTDPLREIR